MGRLHSDWQGEGDPTVVFEAGIAATSLSWALVKPQVAGWTRSFAYDRAGLGYSPAATSPRTLENINGDLRALLSERQVPPPFVLVGHSFGGLTVRHFAQTYPADTAGLVLVDPVCAVEWAHIDLERRRMLARGVLLSRRGEILARWGVVRASLALLMSGSRSIPRLIARASSGRGANVADRLAGEVRKLPTELWPIVQRHWSQPKSFRAMAEHLETLPANAAAMLPPVQLGALPLIVISAASSSPDQIAEHRAIAALSTQGRHLLAEGSGHWIHLDQPQVVVDAIRNVVSTWRGRGQPTATVK